jgi:hypothetical protein
MLRQMNEQIKELLDQCQIETYGVNGELLEFGFDAEKFAELIVQECVGIADEYDGVGSTIVSRIKQHFGVEQ